MNDRIKELAEQVGFRLDSGEWQFADDRDVGKFAELIVLEICKVLDKAQWDKAEDWICADGTRIIPKVKEHFGVEE